MNAAGRAYVIADEVIDELASAVAKFPTWPSRALDAVAIVGEESGELTKAVLQLTYGPNTTHLFEVRREAIQTAAMAIRFIISLDALEYDFSPGAQHQQNRQGGVA